VLEVSTFTVTRSAKQYNDGSVEYDVKVRLSETSGKSGVTLRVYSLAYPGTLGGDYGCSGTLSPQIKAGETWDMDSAGYCAPGSILLKPGDTPSTVTVSFSATFADDDGRVGTVAASVALLVAK
jgi:hypothetical protein